jgi:hypothetical protein
MSDLPGGWNRPAVPPRSSLSIADVVDRLGAPSGPPARPAHRAASPARRIGSLQLAAGLAVLIAPLVTAVVLAARSLPGAWPPSGAGMATESGAATDLPLTERTSGAPAAGQNPAANPRTIVLPRTPWSRSSPPTTPPLSATRAAMTTMTTSARTSAPRAATSPARAVVVPSASPPPAVPSTSAAPSRAPSPTDTRPEPSPTGTTPEPSPTGTGPEPSPTGTTPEPSPNTTRPEPSPSMSPDPTRPPRR